MSGTREKPIVDLVHATIYHRGSCVKLTPKPCQVMAALVAAMPERRPAAILAEGIWGKGRFGIDNLVKVHISGLRGKIAPLGLRIGAIYGKGYVVEDVGSGDDGDKSEHLGATGGGPREMATQ